MARGFLRTGLALLALMGAGLCLAENFKVTFLHTNDFHAHVEPVTVKGVSVGGYARQATALMHLKKESVNPVLLNSGDTFQGTLYFNVYEGLADLAFMNIVGYEAMTVGNHEFDRGVEPLANFSKLARFPMIAANLDISKEPRLAGLVKPSTVLTVAGEKIGVVGSVPPNLLTVTAAGPTIGVHDYVDSIQKEVNRLLGEGINKIVLLSHAGMEVDLDAAPKLRGVDVVIGGHSHTLLGDIEIPGFEGSRGTYPVVVKDAAGRDVPVVQAWEWGKVIGKLEVEFDEKGDAVAWSGGPVLVDDSWPEDPFVASMMAAFKKPIMSLQTQKVADLETDLSQRFDPAVGEGTMGSVIADAVQAKMAPLGSVVSFWNAGGVRAPLESGPVTYGELVEVCPFGNTLVLLELTGAELIAALDHGVSGGGLLLPSRGFSYSADFSATEGKRVTEAQLNGQAIDPKKMYKVTVNSFTAGGGDAHEVLKNAKGERLDTGFVDLEVLIDYFKANTPVKMEVEGRIKVIG